MKETKLINRFSERNYNLGKWVILGPKIAHPHNSGSTGRIFLNLTHERWFYVDENDMDYFWSKNEWYIQKFCRMKGANRYMKVLLVAF